MTFIDTESLLQPVSADKPTGENLEYDASFLELERVAQGKPEQQMGGSVVPAEPPDYKVVLESAAELLTRSKDLRIACHLTTALLHRAGFEGFAQGLELTHQLLERYWKDVHPELDPDENDDPTMRITALAALSSRELLAALRRTPLVESRSFGRVGLHEIAIANGELPQLEDGPKYEPGTVEAAFQEVDIDSLQGTTQALKNAAQHIAGIESTFQAHAGAQGPDLSAVATVVRQASSAAQPRLDARQGGGAQEPIAAEGGAPGDAPVAAAPGGAQRPAVPAGEISSREDVIRVLDKICAYYQRYEPSSPLPIFLERCKRLVPMSFTDIVRDLVPDAMSQVEVLAGKTDNEDE